MSVGLFFESEIKVATDKKTYSSGEMINCTCELDLDEPLKARSLTAYFRHIIPQRYEADSVVFSEKRLGVARTYNKGEKFDFSFPVDQKVTSYRPSIGGLYTALIFALLGRPQPAYFFCEIYVVLDVPNNLDKRGIAGIKIMGLRSITQS